MARPWGSRAGASGQPLLRPGGGRTARHVSRLAGIAVVVRGTYAGMGIPIVLLVVVRHGVRQSSGWHRRRRATMGGRGKVVVMAEDGYKMRNERTGGQDR